MTKHRIFTMPFAKLYPAYVAKAERKGRTRAEVDEVICWLTGHDAESLARVLATEADIETVLTTAPALNPARSLVTGVVCGVRIETLDDPLMRELRILDKLVDELAKGRPMARILRT